LIEPTLRKEFPQLKSSELKSA